MKWYGQAERTRHEARVDEAGRQGAKVGNSTSLSAVRIAKEPHNGHTLARCTYCRGSGCERQEASLGPLCTLLVPSAQWEVQGRVPYRACCAGSVLHVGGLECVFEIAHVQDGALGALRNDTCGKWVVAVAGNPVWPNGTQQPQAPHLLDPRPSPSMIAGAPSSFSSFSWLQWSSISTAEAMGGP